MTSAQDTFTGSSAPTRSARLAARVTLVALALLAIMAVGITLSPWRSGFADDPTRDTNGDIALFRAIVDRVHAGEPFYTASGAEMRERRYPTASVFNWRMPLPLWLVGALPDFTVAKTLLALLALAVLLLGFDWTAREASLGAAIAAGLALTGATMPAVLGDLAVMPELWSGLLIALSLCFYGRDNRAAAVLSGVAALWFRELAAPYVVLMLLLAIRDRQWRELAGWLVGLAGFGVYYGWHATQVLAHRLPTDAAHPQGWIQFLGLPFVISTAQMNCYLLLLPQWITALFLTAAVAGVSRWNSASHARLGLTVLGYCAAFSVAGQDFNQYWGSMYAPLLALAAGRSVVVVRQLIATAGWQKALGRAVQPVSLAGARR